ncbi:DNA-directed RNA polymerases I and III subunit [Lachnellula hyalina]|uniref:DNA-directed RNA polymerases I and III subunit n=1 Tax=Lachnellula hyalina TaxID=1316788 RepID=A0A8H8TY05_9HELO|nr:DNA-directed RNA polymerases I and III subunit [Lachnellula hyalina]TVY26112.1 DNA-directed RNA polymerases I and III subunit [Lachnellula hyalina]
MPPKTKPAEAAVPADDVSMNDEPVGDSPSSNDDPHNPARMAFGEQRIRILPGSSDTAASFEFKGEDHTLGNALRYIIMKKYAPVPVHLPRSPQEYIILSSSIACLEIGQGTAVEALEKGLDDLSDLCDVVEEKFIEARDEYGTPMEA